MKHFGPPKIFGLATSLVSRPVFSSLGLESLHELFFYEVLLEAAPWKRICKAIVQNSSVQSGQ